MRVKTLRRHGMAVLMSLIPVPYALAVTEQDFLARNTQELINLCTVPADDPLRVAAVHFCTGYLVGAYHYHESIYSGPGSQPLVCPPNPTPTRQQAIADFVSWAKAHPAYAQDRPVDTMFRFMVEKWPCRR
jgi:hypothetical protein